MPDTLKDSVPSPGKGNNAHKTQFNLLPKQLLATEPGHVPEAGSSTGADVQSNSSSVNNTLKSKQAQRKSKRPPMQKTLSNFANAKYVYSVDDDPEEMDHDLEREYLEGYNDALRHRYKKSMKNLKELNKDDIGNLTQNVVQGLARAGEAITKLEQREAEVHHHHTVSTVDEDEVEESRSIADLPTQLTDTTQQERDEEGEERDDDDRSISSQESFTLRERQDAINETHPFGIRIWKPALYKKTRSVEREADKDIHDTGSKKTISWEVHLTNLIWSATIGLVFFILCFIGAALLAITGSTTYARVLYNLGHYLVWPWGKIVYLKKDENYLSEDMNEGTTIREYERWRNEDHNKLFFSASYSQAEQPGSNGGPSADHIDPPPTQNMSTSVQSLDRILTLDEEEQQDRKMRFFGRGDWSFGRVVFYIYYYLVLQPLFLVVGLICWLLVLTIPMAKVVQTLTDHLRRHPLAIFYKFDSHILLPSDGVVGSTNILVCTYRSLGLHYYKYTVEGTNIFFINLMFIVIMTIFDFYFFKEYLEWDTVLTNESAIFALCLLSIIPLAYFIGQAVASISAQSSMGVGAVINAFFSTVVEVFLYCVALNQGKGLLVEGSLIGSILAAVLLLPGLSMCAGAFIRKTQRYNPASAGVSCTMLLFSLILMFAPTVLQQIYGSYEIECIPCNGFIDAPKTCQSCHFYQPPLENDYLFSKILKPFSIGCAIVLFFGYTIGLWFTLRTHAALIWSTPISIEAKPKLLTTQSVDNVHIPVVTQSQSHTALHIAAETNPEPQGHDAPNWSRQKSTIVLLGATLLYAIIAEILVDCVDSVLQNFPINPKFLGITIFALVPNTTEFLNAISFATHGNVALSMEIGSAYALQVCLIQIPSLVLYSLFYIDPAEGASLRDSMFTLIFPRWDVIASAVSVGLFTYIYAEGKSNYFKGSILVLVYFVVLTGFYFTDKIAAHGLTLGSTTFTLLV